MLFQGEEPLCYHHLIKKGRQEYKIKEPAVEYSNSARVRKNMICSIGA